MEVKLDKATTTYGSGIDIVLTGEEIAAAVDAWLMAHGVQVSGPRTVTVNGELCKQGRVYVDPNGFVVADGLKLTGRSAELSA